MKIQHEKTPSDALILAGLSPQVLSLSIGLLHATYAIQKVVVVSTIQGLSRLQAVLDRAPLPAHQEWLWLGDDLDGLDLSTSQQRFHELLARLVRQRQSTIPWQWVLGGGLNWMVSLASQWATHGLREERGDGLWVLTTDPHFEHHPHYLTPEDQAYVFTKSDGPMRSGPGTSVLRRLLLVESCPLPTLNVNDELLTLRYDGIYYIKNFVKLPPLQLALYGWILALTKRQCCRLQLIHCAGCVACAVSAKHMAAHLHEFQTYYDGWSQKKGYRKQMQVLDFLQRIPEYVSKINATIRRQGNAALASQLRIDHGASGYLPAVDKNRLCVEEESVK